MAWKLQSLKDDIERNLIEWEEKWTPPKKSPRLGALLGLIDDIRPELGFFSEQKIDTDTDKSPRSAQSSDENDVEMSDLPSAKQSAISPASFGRCIVFVQQKRHIYLVKDAIRRHLKRTSPKHGNNYAEKVAVVHGTLTTTQAKSHCRPLTRSTL